jgi:2Fe-2S ferredoxin
MPIVEIESPHAPTLRVESPAGTRLLDLCDAHDTNAIVPFSCRSASCGTCRLEVLAGGETLEPPQTDEADLLALMGDDPRRCRLACQARLREGALLRVRPATDF